MPALSANFLPEQLASKAGTAFVTSLEDPKRWTGIPLLNYTPLHELKDMSIVRFRGMIQDMLDPEMYLERYEVTKEADNTSRVQEGKYRDCLLLNDGERLNHDAETNVHGERRAFFVISIPGLNEWCHEYESQCSRYNLPKPMITEMAGEGAKKRSAPTEDECMDVEIESAGGQSPDCDAHKRKRTEVLGSADSGRNCSDHRSSAVIGMEYHLNSPIPNRPSKACLIKIYNDFEKYKLNTIVDVVGFLSVNPALDASTMDVDAFDNINEIQAQNPPPSLIPRLHAIAVHCLPHANPLMDERLLSPVAESVNLELTEEFNMLSTGNEFRVFLKLCLFNDNLAAEYLLSHLISSVYCRAETRCLGRFLLNLFNIPQSRLQQYTKEVYNLLDLLIPASHYITMTAETLNDSTFGPKKDYETNKLVSGMLQLAPQTHLVIDETFTKSDTLNSNGLLSMQILGHVMKHQQLKCNFQYYEIEYDVDIPILCFSEKKSVLPYDAYVPIEYDEHTVELIEESLKAAHHYLNPTRLNQFRRFLTTAKLTEFSVNEAESEMIQNDFVEMRKSKSIRDAEELHHLLVLARLLAVARGKNVLDKDAWELAKQMESDRQKRFAALSQDLTRQRSN
ncbi:PREDICTED: mini-chromosome maintenance complex-binding protein [Rhagoletis zephyria]|uniref:mini-chromosome maintenance complex-binding protein n=1 Tax=Rhagoletis zephyria TaxID=28612 RepID=UPI0008114980|nr:PREDICTED: mini-chromosome maintenance complex-binding protein [Rhagoletis zephyria]